MKLENPQEYIGKKYGNTTILKYIGKYRDNTYKFYCKCDCGREFPIKLREKDKVRHCCEVCTAKDIGLKCRTNFFYYYGEIIYIKDLSKKLNIKYETLYSRIFIYKWNMDRWAEPVKRRIVC
jgi:hypothetical protein